MKKNKKTVKLFSSICFVFVLIGISFVSAFSSATSTELPSSSSPAFSVYFISTNKSQVEGEAIALGKDIMKSGGAGYVWKKENYYHVISSAYENENDAQLVSESLKNNNIENEVFEVRFESITITNPLSSPESKSVFMTGLNCFHSLYQKLFDISVSLDTNVYDETSAMIEINRAQATIDEIMKNFHIVFGEIDNPQIDGLEEAIIDANESVGLLSENQKLTEKQTLVSQIRYCYCDICAIFFNFLENFN